MLKRASGFVVVLAIMGLVGCQSMTGKTTGETVSDAFRGGPCRLTADGICNIRVIWSANASGLTG